MIIVKLHGGLGNQMFQYAFGRNLSLKHQVPLKIDTSYLKSPNQSERTFMLGAFKISAEVATTKEISAYIGYMQKILDKLRPGTQKKRWLENPNIFEPEIFERKSGYFQGYWQTEKYFIEHQNAIRKDFELAQPLGATAAKMVEKIASSQNPTSLHVRRGDYVSIKKISDSLGSLPFSYYESAINKVLEKTNNATFFVSSDDIDWVKDHFPQNYSAIFVSSPEIADHEELVLMSLCKHHIIANSSFSWWGAWLDKNPNKLVVAPQHWFKDVGKYSTDMLPASWLKV